MAQTSITLTASMRSNLLSLQNTANLMDQTQERLSTGKKVNSAIDNPSSYYTAQSLTNRASDLSGLLDSMGQAMTKVLKQLHLSLSKQKLLLTLLWKPKMQQKEINIWLNTIKSEIKLTNWQKTLVIKV